MLAAALLAGLNAYLLIRFCCGIGDGDPDTQGISGSFVVLSASGVVVALLTIKNARTFQLRGAEGLWVALGLIGSTVLICLPILIALVLGSN